MTEQSDQPPQFTEEELRALEAELEKITIDEVILQTIVSLVNLGARKAALGAPPDAGIKPDWDQVRDAIEASRALVAVIESKHGDKLAPIRDALAQLQMAYAQRAATAPAGSEAAASEEEGPGPAQSSGRLWVPGQ